MKNIYRLNNNIYIISPTEKVKENTQTFKEGLNGDWYFNIVHNFIARTGDITRFDFKIILTDDVKLIEDGVQHLPDDFLEWFLKNSTCEWVEVQIEIKWKSTVYDQPDIENGYIYKIIVPKQEQKQAIIKMMQQDEELGLYDYGWCKGNVIQTKEDADIFSKELENPSKPNEKLKKAIRDFKKLEEAAEKYSLELLAAKTIQPHEKTWIKSMFIHIAKWQQEQNKNLYTEEEVLSLLNRRTFDLKHKRDSRTNTEWFEQIKKK